MSKIILQNLSIYYPSYGADARSFKKSILNIAMGGKIERNNSRMVTINALSNINLTLNKGDRLALIGHNGAGKSTLLKVLAGIYSPSMGHIQVEGEISALLSINVGMKPGATGYENIYMRALMYGFSKKETEKIIQDVADFTELGNYLAMPVRTYSTGMSVRLAFGIATAIHPDILLIDEIIGTGDAYFLKKAEKRTLSIIEKSNILVFASHSTEWITRLCNKAAWLHQGEIKAVGNVYDVLEMYEADVAKMPVLA